MLRERIIKFTSGGYDVHGILHLPLKQTRRFPCVILFHGLTGDRAEAHFMYTKYARALAEKGMAVLRFDFRGSGDSDMEFTDMSLYTELEDALNAVQFVKGQKEIDTKRIGILGHSMGGFIAASTLNVFPGIKSVVLQSAVCDFKKVWANLARQAGADVKRFPKKGMQFYGSLMGIKLHNSIMELDGYNRQGVAGYDGKLLIIHSDNDTAVPYYNALQYKKLNKAKKLKLVKVKGGFHCFDSVKHETFARKTIVEWFKNTL